MLFPPVELSNMNTAFGLFQYALQKYGHRTIAARIGLHANTVLRWQERNQVPPSYKSDLLRLLGWPDEGTGTDRERDQFYTTPEAAKRCYRIFLASMHQLGIDLQRYVFIEPSVGCGHFYTLLPADRRIGIDINPRAQTPKNEELIIKDYLRWRPARPGKYIVLGNPPFGLRGHLALQFINHSADFADIVAFVLPPLFNSDGKGVPAKRIKSYVLARTEPLPENSFHYPNGKRVTVSTIFQVWTRIKTEKIKRSPQKTCKEYIRVFSLSDGGTPASTRNKKMLYRCDAYLPSTCFTGMHAYPSFEALPHRRGYGIKILRNKKTIQRILAQAHWERIAFRSTNGALNLRSGLIEEVVIRAGYCDGR